ncbi:50S ribosomal protein L29 [Baaleninema simplex]|uniref:50S ribosomal protein L29 n=1 Tax=Baaleninema simplex TaxID=2862350 RepID=UPI00034D1D27|nr:50S ribosomal protein L29 [Baaleninema simplex]
MSLPKIDEVRNFSSEELSQQVLDIKKQLLDLRVQQALGQLEKPHQFKHLRHRLAQLLTVERERELEAAKTAADVPAEAPAEEPAAASDNTSTDVPAEAPAEEPAAASDNTSTDVPAEAPAEEPAAASEEEEA